MLETPLSIKTDRDGQPRLVFRTDARDTVPPETHEERMEWVRSSFSRFYSRVKDSDFAYQAKAPAILSQR